MVIQDNSFLGGQSIDIGCVDFTSRWVARVAVVTDVAMAVIVGKNEDNVRRCWGSRALGGNEQRICYDSQE